MIMVQGGLAKKLLWQRSLSQDYAEIGKSEGQKSRGLGYSLRSLAHWPWYLAESRIFTQNNHDTALRMLNYFGNGQHYYAWIHEKDVVDMFCHALTNSSVRGMYNAVAPNPVPQKKMLVELKKVLSGRH